MEVRLWVIGKTESLALRDEWQGALVCKMFIHDQETQPVQIPVDHITFDKYSIGDEVKGYLS